MLEDEDRGESLDVAEDGVGGWAFVMMQLEMIDWTPLVNYFVRKSYCMSSGSVNWSILGAGIDG